MISELLTNPTLWRGLVLAALGVAFWVGGVVVAHYYWERIRGAE